MTRLLLAVLLLAGCSNGDKVIVHCFDKDGGTTYMGQTGGAFGFKFNSASVRCEVTPVTP